MSQVRVSGNASGTGIFTIASPNSNTDYTLTLPAATTTVVGTDATQTLTNKTIQGGAITSGTVWTYTSGTPSSIDFTSIPSWVKRITVMFSGVSTNGTARVVTQIGAGSVTSSGYSGMVQTFSGSGVGAYTSLTTWFDIDNSSQSAASTRFGSVVLTLITGNTWVMASNVQSVGSGGLGAVATGSVTLSGTLDRVRITTSGVDTFDAGSINILYE